MAAPQVVGREVTLDAHAHGERHDETGGREGDPRQGYSGNNGPIWKVGDEYITGPA